MKELTELEHSKYWLRWYNNNAHKYSRMVSDSDTDKVYQYVMIMKCAVHIYVEHKDKGNAEEVDVKKANIDGVEPVEEANVGDIEQVEKVNVGGVEQVKDTEDSGDSDFEADGLSFYDSEDERALGLDNCFDVIENQVEERGK
ncbi:hypothetical protein KIW84_014998 [Lathyrus oleraceus]|uniref:Uncharacterized protein n=1 Tax=Pisum sativum TaxID=3888 RepID=A0A9D5BP40_PEA|nr:hypothetical protein KIW84_014998 [Pisum sativum]